MKRSDSPPLEELTVEVTRQCLLKCVHCSALAEEMVKEELTKAEMEQIISDFLDLGGKELAVSGGEPFCYPDLYEIIQFAKKGGLTVQLYTCGFFGTINEIQLLEKSRELKRLKVNKVFVNLQGPNAEIHDDITKVSGSFKEAVKFIRALIEEGLYVGVNYVPMKPNLEEFVDLVDYVAQELKVQEVSVLRFVPQGRGKLNEEWLTLSKDESARLIQILTKARKRQDINVTLGAHIDFCFLIDSSYSPKSCTAGTKKCLVKANGDVVPCSAFKELPNYIVGNIRTSALRTLWTESSTFDLFRKFDSANLKGSCARCPHLNVCQGRCIAQRIHKLGEFYKGPDPYCPRGVM